ncbi:hypothetical protein NBRC116595_13170 [Aliiglaciecola sp. NS0011-25]
MIKNNTNYRNNLNRLRKILILFTFDSTFNIAVTILTIKNALSGAHT